MSALIIKSDAFHIPLASDSVQAVVTSPPYYKLRKYAGTPEDALGWEKTVELYVRNTIKVLREIRRVVRWDGCVFWIIGDSYFGSNRGRGSRISKLTPYCEPSPLLRQGLAKSLCLIPERIKVAAQDHGWIVRSTIIWQKPNCVPESVKDRCAQSYEQIIMLARCKNYFWNTAEAVEPSVCWQKATCGSAEKSLMNRRAKLQLTMRHGNKIGCSKTEKRLHNFIGAGLKGDTFISEGLHGERSAHRMEMKPTRTLRDVWSIPTHAHPEDHVAIFREALVERLIRISTKPGDTVLDPFAGSGTTGIVAERLGRNSILLDSSEQYCQLMKRRILREDAIYAN